MRSIHPTRVVRRLIGSAVLVGLLAVSVVACGDSSADEELATEHDTGDHIVVVEDMSYAPESLTVPAGTTVTWEFEDGEVGHNVVGDGFESEIQSEGSYTHTFEEAGSYEYHCSLHPNMVATIEVTS